MKLNLPNCQCARFEIRANFPISELDEETLQSLVAQTSHHDHDPTESGHSDSTVGIFGSRFVVEGSNLRSVANLGLERRDGRPWARVWLLNNMADESLPRPPRWIKPVSLLMRAALESFAPTSAECSGVFEYHSLDGWKSKLVLPVPMIVQDSPHGITHIESAEFSNRDDDGVNYRIEVQHNEERDAIVHTVRYEYPLDWSRRSLRLSLQHGRAISGHMMAREGQG